MNKSLVTVSKYLSYILRHRPDEIGLTLDQYGWGDIETLIARTTEVTLDREVLQVVVETNDKQRFAISADGRKIRANQGHSIQVDLDLAPQRPPAQLLHGTAERFWPAIQQQGLIKGQRHHVHLTQSAAVATAVGRRYGNPVLLSIDAQAMHQTGFTFYQTVNHVWLVAHVPAEFITLTSPSPDYD